MVSIPKMKHPDNQRRAYYVVQFIDLPFEGIDDYVCVPFTWMILKCEGEKAIIAYPKDEDPFITRDRVKRKERCHDEYKFYIATVKYETDSHEDAEYWIARNDYGPLVEEELKTTGARTAATDADIDDTEDYSAPISSSPVGMSEDQNRKKMEINGAILTWHSPDTEPKFPLNKKLRSANLNHRSKLNDNPRTPLPRISIKRPVLPEPNKQPNRKRMKMDDATQSSSAVVTDANAKPGSSRQEQSIITQDNQPMESAQTETTACGSNGTSSSTQRKGENLQESLPIQEQQELSMPSIDVDTPTLVIDDDKEVQPTSIKEQQRPSNQVISQFTEQPEPIREPQIPVVPSREMTSNNQGSRMDNASNNGPTSHHLLNSLNISAQLYSHTARRSIPTQKPVERKIRPMNIARNFVIAEQNPSNLINQTGSLSTRSAPTQQHYHTSSYQNQYLPTNRNNFEQDLLTYLLRKTAESNNYRQRPNSRVSSRTISMTTPSIGQNSIIPSTPSYQTSELSQQRQSQPSQQDSQRQPQKLKIRIGISTKPKNNRQTPTIQVTKETLSPILTKIINSVRRALSATHNQHLLNEQQMPENHCQRARVNENHLNAIDDTLQTDEWMEEETPSVHHGANSDSDTIIDHEVISDHKMSEYEAPIQRTNNFHGTRMTSGNSCADRPIAAQNSTNHQTHSKVVLEQQMLDNFATLFTQMGSTLRYTTDMYNTLRDSILDTAKTYKKLMGAVDEFNSAQNLASTSSSSSNRREEVSQLPKEIHIKISARANSNNTNRYKKKVANTLLNKKHKNSGRFVLPPEYDPHYTKWTLKYRKNLPGLVELMPQSGVYVSYKDLKYYQQVSEDCKSLALRLLPEVFNRKALSVCLSMTERAQASDNVGSHARPELDAHACTVLLNFVLEHGLQRGWNTDLRPILNTLDSKIKEIRFEYDMIVELLGWNRIFNVATVKMGGKKAF